MKRQTLSYVLLFKKWAMGGIVLSPPMVECVSSHISKTNWANSMIDDCFLAQYKSERVREKVMPITHLIQPQISGCSKRDHSKLVHQEMSELMVKSRNKAGENLKTQIYSFPCPQLLFPASEFIILQRWLEASATGKDEEGIPSLLKGSQSSFLLVVVHWL